MKSSFASKDKRIKKLIDYLFQKYGEDKIKIKDYWDADKSAIGVADNSENYLIYISTFGVEGSRSTLR